MPVVEKPEPKDEQNENTDELLAPDEEIDSEPLLEPDGVPDSDPKKVHPLTPGGRRFEQVYAEAKQAKRDLARERELRIAAEAKISVLSPVKETQEVVEKDVEYSWDQLDGFIKEGRITRADAEAHREAVLTKRIVTKVKGDVTNETKTATRSQILSGTIQQYVEAVPDILTAGSAERVRLDEEFDWLASVQGFDSTKIDDTTRKALQLTALRNVYGSVDSLEKRSASPKGESHQGLPGGKKPQGRTNPDQALLDGLTKREFIHYNKMFRSGRYPNGWKDVVAELKFDAKAPRAK